MKWGGAFREFLRPFCPALSGMKVTQSSLCGENTFKVKWQASFSRTSLFVNKQKYAPQDGKR